MTSGENITEEEYKKETEYLREAVRLAELRLEEQQKTSDIIRRQTVLLITYGAAAFTYLHAGEPAMPLKQHWFSHVLIAGNIIVAAAFIKAVYHCVGIFDIKKWGVPGADADYLLHEYFGKDFNKMAENLLENYREIFNQNEKNNGDKINEFIAIRKWGMAGIAGASVLIIAEKTSLFIL